MRLSQGSARRFSVVAVGLALNVGCDASEQGAGPGHAPGTGGGAGAPGEPDSPCGPEDASSSQADAAALFEGTSIPTFDFYLPAERWEYLQAHAVEEQYVEADACFNGGRVGRVGLRFKGAYGSLFTCFDSTGVNVCRKLGMKVKFDEYADEQRFYGLKRLNFQGNRYDGTYLKEKLSYDLYREMGIVAPRAAWALLRVNGEEQGLFGMVEQVDGRFTEDRFSEDGDGTLYKEVWPGEMDEAWIRDHLETNEETADLGAFLAFSSALNQAPASELAATLGRYADLEYLARYMVVDDAIANFDGITTFYSFGAPARARNHNFYLYEESPERFTLIPWDLESTLSLASGFGSVPFWQDASVDCAVTHPVWGGGSQVVAPGCDTVFRALAADLEPYRSAARELLDGPFAQARLLERIEHHAAVIRDEAHRDPRGPGAEQFEQEVAFLKEQIPALRRRLEHLVSGTRTTPLVVELDRLADFEDVEEYSLHDGTLLLANPASTAAVELNTATPIAGEQSLRIAFELNNEAEPWQQWLFYTVPLAPLPVDLSVRTGIRFKVRSSVARPLRIDLESPEQSRASEGIKVGWELAVDSEVSEHTLAFADATVPTWAADPGDDLTAILQSAFAISILPQCVGRDETGQLPAGTSDPGVVDIDDLEIY